MLSAVYAECRKAECCKLTHYAECRYADFRYAECHDATGILDKAKTIW
jgi:hypothetical protein